MNKNEKIEEKASSDSYVVGKKPKVEVSLVERGINRPKRVLTQEQKMSGEIEGDPEEAMNKANLELSVMMNSILKDELNSQLGSLQAKIGESPLNEEPLEDILNKIESLPDDIEELDLLDRKINIINMSYLMKINDIRVISDKVEIARRNIERITQMLTQNRIQEGLFDNETVKSLQVALQRNLKVLVTFQL